MDASAPDTAVCAACGASVAKGRLSCPECGTLMAAVSGPPDATEAGVPAPMAARAGPAAAAPTPPQLLRPVERPPAPAPEPPGAPAPAAAEPQSPTPPGAAAGAGALPPREAVVAPGARPLGPNEWYSERFRAAAGVPATQEAPAPRAGSAGFLSDLPIAAPPAPMGWSSIAGSWLLTLALLLPWRPNLDYFSVWGIAQGRNFLVFIAALGVALVTILPLRLHPSVRLGLLPLLLGAFSLGLVWRQLDSQGSQIGVWLFLAGGLLAVAGGIWILWRVGPEELEGTG